MRHWLRTVVLPLMAALLLTAFWVLTPGPWWLRALICAIYLVTGAAVLLVLGAGRQSRTTTLVLSLLLPVPGIAVLIVLLSLVAG